MPKQRTEEPAEQIVKATPRGVVSSAELQAMEWFDPSAKSEPEERMIPYIRLMQGLSNEVKERTADVGQFLVSTGVNLGKKAVIVPLWMQRQAVKYDKDGGESADCRSNDGVTGDKYGECRRCRFYYRLWTTDDNGKRIPPECSAIVTFPSLVLSSENIEDGDSIGVVAFQFARSSFPVAKQIVTQHDLKGLPYYAYQWEISSRAKKFKKGEAAIFTARFLGPNTVELMKQAQAACQAWAGAGVEISDKTEFEEVSGEGMDEASTSKAVDRDEIPF